VIAGAAAGSSLATGAQAGEDAAAVLAGRSAIANDALMRGDADRYRAIVNISRDFTLMSPFGGAPSRPGQLDDAGWASIGRFFRNGSLTQELVQAYGSRDMVALVVIERADVEVGGLARQPWNLRVTLVYRRDADGWALVHRHADPLAPGITVPQAAALARGEPAAA
jgi:ketosteroid isomerase-like protein